MDVLICPKCQSHLAQKGKSLVCESGHCFDTAASGYTNLLLSEQMNAKLPGDNKLMVNSRRDFLGKGYYAVLARELCSALLKYTHGGVLLDAGCGEGYYTYNMAKALADNGVKSGIFGTDISKTAVNAAAKRFKDIGATLFVSSIFHLPVASGSVDILTTLFAPFCREEYLRVLKKGGVMIMVIPSEMHLFGLKKAVYDQPYKNEVKDFSIEGMELIGHIPVRDEITLDNTQDIQSLFTMTPYYYKTGRKEQARLEELENLTTEIGFEVLVYKA